MLTVEQIRSLDEKVRKALSLIENLKSENSMLRAKLDEYKERVGQLETVVDGFKLEQLEIEEGIKDVLTQLDQLEDQITAPAPPSPEIAKVLSETSEVPVQTSEPLKAPLPGQTSVTQPEPAEQAPELEIF